MSKSIYEEALENLHIHEHQLEETKIFERKFDLLKKVKQALQQAQKKEKLLELYKKLTIIYEKFYTMELSELSLNSNYYEIEIIKLKHQIKEIENEI